MFDLSIICVKNLRPCKFRKVSGVRDFSELPVKIKNLKQYDSFTSGQDGVTDCNNKSKVIKIFKNTIYIKQRILRLWASDNKGE